jgi:4-hydroxyphenylpyruvate dioxygenase
MSLSSTPPTPAATPWDNPMGTDGFEFIEYAAPDPQAMGELFERMGFKAIAKHRHKAVTLYRQGGINFILNAEPDSFAQRFARLHGPSICAIAFRVQDAKAAYERALSLGAWGYAGQAAPGELNIPAIKGIGDSIIYFIDRWRGKNGAKDGDIGNIGFYDVDFRTPAGCRAEPRWLWHDGDRPPDAQRAPRPHGRVGGLLRATFQFPRGALLRP